MNIHSQNDSDWFRIRLDQEGGFDNFVRLESRAGAVGLVLELRSSSGAMVASSAADTDARTIMLNGLAAGEYLIRDAGADLAQKGFYSLSWNTEERTISPDAHDAVGRSNDTQAEAVELIGAAGMLGGLNIHRQTDTDWFTFHLDGTGTNDDHVTAHFFVDGARSPDFPHGGDLNLFLHDGSGSLIRSSALAGYDNERIPLNGLRAGDYYVRVEGADAQQRNAYVLSWNTSHGTEHDPEPETPVLKPEANPSPDPGPAPDPDPEPDPDPAPPAPPTTTFYMGADGFVGARGTARIFGSTGREGAFIYEEATDVALSSAVEEAHFTLASFAYTFYSASGQIEVWKVDDEMAVRMAVIPAGTELRFVDGAATAAVNPETGQIILGGKPLKIRDPDDPIPTFYDLILDETRPSDPSPSPSGTAPLTAYLAESAAVDIHGPARVYGFKGTEKAYIHDGAHGVNLSPTVEEAHFELSSFFYRFSGASGQIVVWQDGSRVAHLSPKTDLRFADGGVTAGANPETGRLTLGNVDLTTEPTPDPLELTLDRNRTSSIGRNEENADDEAAVRAAGVADAVDGISI